MAQPNKIAAAYLGLGVILLIVLVRSGGDDHHIIDRVTTNVYVATRLVANFEGYRVCLDSRSQTDKELEALTLALVAVENFARSRLVRHLEILVARIYLSWRGTLPNLSLGLAQMRVRTAEQMAIRLYKEPTSNNSLLDLIETECGSLQLAYEYVVSLDEQLENCRVRPLQASPIHQDMIDRTINVFWHPKLTRAGEPKAEDMFIDVDIRSDECINDVIRQYNGQSGKASMDVPLPKKLYLEVTRRNFLVHRPINSPEMLERLFQNAMQK